MRSPTDSTTFGITGEGVPWGRSVSAWGELDIAAVPRLRERLDEAVAGGTRRLLLDFEGVTFIDSVVLAAVVATQRRMGAEGRMVVATRHPYVLLILEAGGLDSVIEVFPSRDEAEAALLE